MIKQAFFHMRGMLCLLLTAILLLTGCTAADTGTAADAAATAAQEGASSGADAASTPEDGAPPAFPGGMGGGGFTANNGVTTEATALHADISDRDAAGTWDDDTATHITLSGTTAAIEGKGASFAGNTLTIDSAGVYVLTGTLTGSVVVDAKKDDKVQLVLSGASVTSPDGSAINVLQADKVFVTAAAQTQNSLTDAAEYANLDGDDEPDACLFSKDDLTINGAGALTVTGSYKHGIVSKDELVLCDIELTVTAATDGIKSNDGTTVAGDARLRVTAGDDALETEGNCIIESGALTLNAGNDGVHGDAGVYCNGGTIDIESSTEGLEGLVVYVGGGVINIVASDDGVNASSSSETTAADATTGGQMGGGTFNVVPGAIIAIMGGKLTVSASGDGLDSNGDLLIAGGETVISIDMHTGNSALDYNGGCELTGGTLVAADGGDMTQSVLSSDELPMLCATLDSEQAANVEITLKDGGGNALLTFTPDHAWRCVTLRTPDMHAGDTVALYAGETALASATLDSAWTTYGNAAGFGGRGGGKMPRGDMPEGMEPPDGTQQPPQGGGRRGGQPGTQEEASTQIS